MKKMKLAYLVASLAVAVGAQASTPCEGFQIKIKNKLAENLIVSNIRLSGAQLQSNSVDKINPGTEQVFTVNQSLENIPIVGNFVFYTKSFPNDPINIHFDLKQSGLICKHTDDSPDSRYALDKTRLLGKVDYTISTK